MTSALQQCLNLARVRAGNTQLALHGRLHSDLGKNTASFRLQRRTDTRHRD